MATQYEKTKKEIEDYKRQIFELKKLIILISYSSKSENEAVEEVFVSIRESIKNLKQKRIELIKKECSYLKIPIPDDETLSKVASEYAFSNISLIESLKV